MKKIIPIIIGIFVIAGITMYSQNKKAERRAIDYSTLAEHQAISETEMMMNKGEAAGESMNNIMENDVMMDDEKMAMVDKPGSFIVYENVNISELEGNIVLDFSATWCPSCRTFKKNVEENLMNIPADLTLVLVDYDTNKDLRREYGVTSQHTFVQIDNAGNKIKMWSGGSTLQSVVDKLI